MVYIGGRGEESVRRRADNGDGNGGGVAMAMGTERSKPPLHNFNLPSLKWGNQRQLRCMNPPDSSNSGSTNPRRERGISFDRHRRSSRSPPLKFAASSRDYEARHHQFKKPRPRIDGAGGGGGGADEGIEALGEKLMFDLKTAADRMKHEILRKEVCDEEEKDDDEEDADGDRDARHKSSSPPATMGTKAAVAVSTGGGEEKEHEPRPWNLRTRRAACKAPVTTANAPIGAGASASPAGAATAKGLRIEEPKESSRSSPIRSDSGKLPRLRGGEKKEPRAKFTVSLSRKEIEDDFMAMIGHRPARRPKKRPRIVQKQMDTLFPGLWLGEVTVDSYKVPEIPDIGKR
ncbi:unnamed protein product [Linum tenue]|uniref:DUF1639 family protein n=1 Tax=Linum tenue TaxID=586396 RepID=A0AAV0N7X9_9ROSI|nr:unnamed protein product [Linum tenue]